MGEDVAKGACRSVPHYRVMARAVTGSRLHFGFRNLSLARDRLYGGVGTMIEEPEVTVIAEEAAKITCKAVPGEDSTVSSGAIETVRRYLDRIVSILDVPGASVTIEASPPRHVGLGSGTQLALATLTAVAEAYDRAPRTRERAPALGRGGRSGVGVAGFEQGGFVVDAGHPSSLFTTEPPERGNWSVPPVIARHSLPPEWRFVVALPDAAAGRSDKEEDKSMRVVVERANVGIADDLDALLVGKMLPAIAAGQLQEFGNAIAEFGRLNGAWYADQQGGIYRPPAGQIVEAFADSPAVVGAGQSSWGPTVYGVTDDERADEARNLASAILSDVGGGKVIVARPRNEGARPTEST